MHFYKEACTHVCAYAVFSGSSLGLEGTLGNTGIQICSLPVQFSQFKHHQPAFAQLASKSIAAPESPVILAQGMPLIPVL